MVKIKQGNTRRRGLETRTVIIFFFVAEFSFMIP